MSDKWHNRFLNLANHIATEWSLDPSTKVGSVIVDDDRRIVSVGYNGFPQGIADTKERLENRDVKYKMIVHAERNALLFANKSVKGCTLYNIPFMPCSVCAGMIIQAGIKTVVSYQSDNPRWGDDQIAKQMFAEAGVELLFFKNPNVSDYEPCLHKRIHHKQENKLIYQELNSKWYFYDEKWIPHGPYETSWGAEIELILYYKTVTECEG